MIHRLEQNEKMKMVMPILENGFINAICLHDTREEELQEYLRLFDYRDVSGHGWRRSLPYLAGRQGCRRSHYPHRQRNRPQRARYPLRIA